MTEHLTPDDHLILKHYANMLKHSPDDWRIHYDLGLFFLKKQHDQGAEVQFSNVIRLHPTHAKALFYLGCLTLKKNEHDTAEAFFKESLAHDDTQPLEILVNLGVIALQRSEGQAAVAYFTEALTHDHEHLAARSNLAATFMHYGRHDNALTHYQILLKQDPSNLEYRYNAGVAEMMLHQLTAARHHFKILLQKHPHHVDTLINLASIAKQEHQDDESEAYLKQAFAYEPHHPLCHHLLEAHDETVEASTHLYYTKHLFDQYALYYDRHLQETLHSTLSDDILNLLQQYAPHSNHYRTLDLGCGTGLTGSCLRPLSQYLVGVDLSDAMLRQAHQKNIYDELILGDIDSFLRTHTSTYNIIVCADVFPYLGSLQEILKHIYDHLSPEGLCLFNTEISAKRPWYLQKTVRFAHHDDYIRQQLHQHGYIIIFERTQPTRQHHHEPLRTHLWMVQRGVLS